MTRSAVADSIREAQVDPNVEALASAHGQGRQGISKRTISGSRRRRLRGSHFRDFTGHLREAWRRAGQSISDPIVAKLIEEGRAPIAGSMPTGMEGAAFMHNLPPEGTFVMDSELFFTNTERNDVPGAVIEYPGFGGAAVNSRISNVGVLSGLQIIIEATLKISGVEGEGTVTPTFQWPWNLIKAFALSANGQTSLLSCEGLDMRARRQAIYRNPDDPISVAKGIDAKGNPELKALANGESSVFLIYDVPIIHDWFTLTGSLFAQSDQIYLSWHLQPPQLSELFTTAKTGKVELLKASIKQTTTFFDVPFANTQQGRKVLVPDLQWLHGFVSSDFNFANQGEVQVPLIRTSGELLKFYFYLNNGGATVIEPAALTGIRFEYGGNRKPRVHEPPQTLLAKNVEDYNGLILPKVGFAVFDFEADNPSRDLVFPKGVTELKVTPVIPGTIEVNKNAKVHFIEEALFAGR